MEQEFLALVSQYRGIIIHAHTTWARYVERDDIVQEILLNAWKNFGTFKSNGKFSTWFYALCRNTCIYYLRKNKWHQQTLPINEDVLNGITDDTYDVAKDIKELSICTAAMAKLHDVEKRYFKMYLNGLSFRQMEHLTGVDENTMRVRIHRIKKRLKANPDQYGRGA